MRINNSTSPNFRGIKFSHNCEPAIYNMVKSIEKHGFKDIGTAGFLTHNCTVSKKAELANFLREGDIIEPNEFAAIFLHSEKECWLIGHSISLEQKMLPIVQKYDPDARLNLSI